MLHCGCGCREESEAAFLEQEEDELAVAIAAMEDGTRRESQAARMARSGS